MTTKEQERKALDQIRKIMASLGEDSYVATAFEGCIEIAEQNIENDFACSMKQRAESAEKQIEILRADNGNILKAMSKKDGEIESLKKQVGNLEERIIGAADIAEMRKMVFDARCEAEKEMEATAAEIVKLADNPMSEEFRMAVKGNRAANAKAIHMKMLDARLADVIAVNK